MKVQAFSKIEPVGAYILPVNGTTVQEYLIDRAVLQTQLFSGKWIVKQMLI